MAYPNNQNILQLSNRLQNFSLEEGLQFIVEEFKTGIVFSTSFSFEDQTIAHAVLSQQLPVDIFTLDTGRLFAETYSVWSSTNERYNTKVKAYYPDYTLLEPFIQQKGPNSFYESVENRKTCCHIRKVEPLKRALAGNQVWITGLRAEHSPAREHLQIAGWDEANQIIKYNPLLHWTTGEVKKYIRQNNIPCNVLHDKGFVSIGCAPCTRAIQPDEDFRAGRWWWEDNSKKECGLHAPIP